MILVPSTVVLPPKPIGPMPSWLASSVRRSSRAASSGSGLALVQLAEQDFLGCVVGGAAVAADGHAQDARRAALALGLVDRIQHHLAHPGQVAPGAQAAIGQGILRAHVLAAAALEHQLDGQGIAFHFFEVDGGEMLAAQVVAAVLVGERVDRVGAQVGLLGGLRPRRSRSAARSLRVLQPSG